MQQFRFGFTPSPRKTYRTQSFHVRFLQCGCCVCVFVFLMRVFFTLFQRCMLYPCLLHFSSTPSGKCYPFLSPRFPFKLQELLFLGPCFATPSLMPPLTGAAEWGFLYTTCHNAAKMQDGAGMGMVRVLKRVSFLFASSTSFPPGHLLATLCETLFSSTLSTRLLMFLFPFPVLSISTELPLPTVSLLSFVGRTFSK